MTKRKGIILVSIIAILVVAVVGVSFAAIWATKPIEFSYTVGTEVHSTVVIDSVGVASKALAPAQGATPATVATSEVKITVVSFANNLTFSIMGIEYEETTGVWVAVPNGVLGVQVLDALDNSVISGAHTQAVGTATYVVSAKLLQPVELIDPIYKNKNFRYKVNVDCVRVAV